MRPGKIRSVERIGEKGRGSLGGSKVGRASGEGQQQGLRQYSVLIKDGDRAL